jgi:DNA invertase Pin-like site-specific DNA recombinase
MKAVYRIVGEIEDKIASPENVVDDAKVYTDLNSGTVKFIDRPEGNKLMLEIENGIISELYVYSIDRFGRMLAIF